MLVVRALFCKYQSLWFPRKTCFQNDLLFFDRGIKLYLFIAANVVYIAGLTIHSWPNFLLRSITAFQLLLIHNAS